MKALIRKNAQNQDRARQERRKFSSDVKSKISSQKRADNLALNFTQHDYQDIIDIKNRRATKMKNRSAMFFHLGLAIVLLFVNVAFNWKFVEDASIDEMSLLHNVEFDEMLEVPNTEQPPPPPPKVLQPKSIIEVPDEEIIEKVNVEIDMEVTEDMSIEAVVFEEIEIEDEKAEEIFEIVENRPEPKGGIKAFYQYVTDNIKYPQTARRMDISGRVFLKFVVDKEGYVKNVQAIKGIGGGCDEEAIRIVQNSPRWIPGTQRGKPVSVYMMLPITFKLEK